MGCLLPEYELNELWIEERPFLNILDWGSNSITSNTWGEFDKFLKSFIHINELRIYLKLCSYFKYMYITQIFFANNFADNAWDSNHSIFHQTGNCTKLSVEQHVLLPAESLCCFKPGVSKHSKLYFCMTCLASEFKSQVSLYIAGQLISLFLRLVKQSFLLSSHDFSVLKESAKKINGILASNTLMNTNKVYYKHVTMWDSYVLQH